MGLERSEIGPADREMGNGIFQVFSVEIRGDLCLRTDGSGKDNSTTAVGFLYTGETR